MSAQPVDVLGRRVPVHKSKVVLRRLFGVAAVTTTTLCGRSRAMADGMNITDCDDDVTCKLCRAALARVQAIGSTNPFQQLADHEAAIARIFRGLGRKLDADLHEGRAEIFQRRAIEEAQS